MVYVILAHLEDQLGSLHAPPCRHNPRWADPSRSSHGVEIMKLIISSVAAEIYLPR